MGGPITGLFGPLPILLPWVLANSTLVTSSDPSDHAAANWHIQGMSDVSAVCDTVAKRWSRIRHSTVRQVDTTMDVISDSVPRRGCSVWATAPQSLDSIAQNTLYWSSKEHRGWIDRNALSAYGPDGSIDTYERRRIRCQVEIRQPGGDDSDTAAVPIHALSEITFCWKPNDGR